MNSQPKPNPINPPTTGHAVLVFATLVLCAAFAEVATGLVAPAMPVMGHLFAKSPATMQLTIVSFAVPFALGQLFFGPFSDAKGRRPALLLGAVFTVVGSIVAGSADTIWMVFLARVVQGLGAAAGYVVARAMIRDIYGPQGAAKAMALLFALMSASFMVAPLIGGSLLDVAGWRAGFIFAAAIAAVWLASTVLIMPETRGMAAQSRPEAVSTIYLRLFRHRGFLGFMLTHATGYAGLYCFVAGAPYYFIDSRDMTATGFGLIAALAMSGFLIGSTAARFAIPRFGMGRVIYASLAVMVLGPGGAWLAHTSTPGADYSDAICGLVWRRLLSPQYRCRRHDVPSASGRRGRCRVRLCANVCGRHSRPFAGSDLRRHRFSNRRNAAFAGGFGLCDLASLKAIFSATIGGGVTGNTGRDAATPFTAC